MVSTQQEKNNSQYPLSKQFKHRQLCEKAASWLKTKCKQRCPVVFVEIKSISMEIPDVIGFNCDHSVMIEVKTTRRDFLKDKEKPWRKYPEQGVGDFRYYFCPEGIIKEEDLPEKWGLIWVDKSNRVRIVKEVVAWERNFSGEGWLNKHPKSNDKERNIMYSALRRL